MPKNKDLKRLTRARMRKTGEAYTTARAHLVNKKAREAEAMSVPLSERAGMSDETVSAKTGRNWEQWVGVLDAESAASMPHSEIASLLRERFGLSGWWSQSVTVGYERIRGLREIGQRRDGAREANKSRTIAVPLATLYRAFSVGRTRNRWLPDVKPTVRTAIPEKSMRWTWPDGTSVHVYFASKGEAKSQVAVQHVKLATAADVERAKQYWGERLTKLAALLVPSRSLSGPSEGSGKAGPA